jgi:hypothetical protein
MTVCPFPASLFSTIKTSLISPRYYDRCCYYACSDISVYLCCILGPVHAQDDTDTDREERVPGDRRLLATVSQEIRTVDSE